MATTTQPYLSVKLFGDGLVTKIDETYRWDAGERLEKFVNLVTTDGPKTIDFSDVDNVYLIVIKSKSPVTLHMTIDGSTVALETDGFFSIRPTANMISLMTSFQIEATQETAQKIEVRVYGEAPPA